MKAGFIGLGQQVKYLAINLAEAGHDLMVYDVRREPVCGELLIPAENPLFCAVL